MLARPAEPARHAASAISRPRAATAAVALCLSAPAVVGTAVVWATSSAQAAMSSGGAASSSMSAGVDAARAGSAVAVVLAITGLLLVVSGAALACLTGERDAL
ncbi:hypothetical protein [Actinomyces timonensis]|uniref:hypothetical protein n=1 Tax=Actinomyces timonensis TaxID=1288391 RepID=UPI0012B61BE9|nr:hypothetical protein [Actinomyces timonensis]